MVNSLEFAQLLASRICHDLISPISAVNNGIELLLEDDNEQDPLSYKRALELVEESAHISALKLKLMRAAFGAGQSLPDNNKPKDFLDLCQPIAAKNKVQILWDNNDETYILNRTQGQIILNLILLFMESLPRGGMIEFTHDKNHFDCKIESEKLFFSDEKISYLLGIHPIPTEPRYIGFMVLHFLSPETKYVIEKNNNSLNIKFTIS
jgi:histidine phosphotransferase ChpT